MTMAYGKKRYDRLWLGEGRARRGFLLNYLTTIVPKRRGMSNLTVRR